MVMAPNHVAFPAIPPTVQKVITSFQLSGWISFWMQLLIAAVAGTVLTFSTFSRNLDETTNKVETGFAIFLAGLAIVALCFHIVICFRYTRFAKRLQNADPNLRPQKEDTVRIVKIGLLASLIGLFIALSGAGISTSVLLAKAIAQPQGAAIYNPVKILRVLDILVVIVNIALAGAHFIGNIVSLVLLRQLNSKLEF